MTPGLNLFLWTDEVTAAHRPLFDRLARLGYGAVEVPVLHTAAEAPYAAIRGWCEELGLARSSCAALPPSCNPASADPAVRAAARDTIRRSIDCSAALGATVLVGPLHSALGHFSGVAPTDDEWRWSVETMRAVGEHAAQAGIALSIEPLNRFECYLLNDQRSGARYVRDVGLANVGLLYDTFHAHIEEKDPAAALAEVLPLVNHFHVSENDRSTPGAGQVRWAETFATLKRGGWNGVLMVEAFGTALPALAAATRIWRPMFESQDRLAAEAIGFLRRAWAAA